MILAIVPGTIIYYGLSLNDGEDRYAIFIWSLFLILAVSESVMQTIASFTKYFIVGIAAGALIFGSFMIVQGFFVSVDDLPSMWKWLHYVSFHGYAFENFIVN
jgi:ABC-type multidrug transport system permease subunit